MQDPVGKSAGEPLEQVLIPPKTRGGVRPAAWDTAVLGRAAWTTTGWRMQPRTQEAELVALSKSEAGGPETAGTLTS